MHTKQEITTQSKVFFRADGNSQIGLGHVIRSLALVDMVKNDFECHFIIQEPSEAIQQQILTVCPNLHTIPQTQHYHQEAEQIIHQYLSPEDIVILDGYNFDTTYQKTFKNNGNSLICVDDVPAFHFYADAILNHAAGVNPSDYSAESYTQYCLGLDYALLRKPFLEAARQARTLTSFDKVFICFGGADAHNLTQQAAEVCVNLANITEIHVVLGSAYNSYQEFTNFASQHPHLKIHQNLNAAEMCALMQSCDVAITSTSSIGYEVMACGLVWLGGYYVNNQINIYNGFKELECMLDLGDLRVDLPQKLRTHFEKINQGKPQIKRLIKGDSSQRILQIVHSYAHSNTR